MIKFKLKAKAKPASPVKNLGDGLPTTPTSGEANPISLRWLAIAPPSWGKTEFFMSFPDSLLLACEEGHKLVKGMKMVIDCFDYLKEIKPVWTDSDGNRHASFLQAVELLQKTDRFKFIIIDTVDALVKMIIDYTCASGKVEHIEELGAYGRGYDVGQNAPFRRAVNAILKTGRGIGYTTHQSINEKQFKKGPQAKKETTLPSGIVKLIVPQVDIAIHGEFGKRRKPNKHRDRVAISEGSDEALAKNRGGILPAKFLIPYKMEDRWRQIESFFKDNKNVAKAEAEYEKLYEI